MGVPYPWVSAGKDAPASEGWGAGVPNADAPDGGSGPGYSRPYPTPVCIHIDYQGLRPRQIAEAQENIDKVVATIPVMCADGAKHDLPFGDDITFGTGGKVPYGSEVPQSGAAATVETAGKFDPQVGEAQQAVMKAEAELKSATTAAGSNESGSQSQVTAAKKALDEARQKLNDRLSKDSYEMTLRQTIGVLPKSFDGTGKAQREFDAFLKKNGRPQLYTDPELDKAVAADENFIAFSEYTVNDPKGKHFNPAALRIHQKLEKVNWDINQVMIIADLRTLAFDRGSALFKSGNYQDGLKIMIDAVSHVLVFVDEYHYDSCAREYNITLTFELYDAFGLDDEDVEKFGYKAHLQNQFSENLGFTAWWQLQHQFNYAPLVTKAVVKKHFSVSTRP